jgi:hypothetical protein
MKLLLRDATQINLTEFPFHLINIGEVRRGARTILEVTPENSEILETGDLLLLFVHGTELLVGPLPHSLVAFVAAHRDLRLRKVLHTDEKHVLVNIRLANSEMIGRQGVRLGAFVCLVVIFR